MIISSFFINSGNRLKNRETSFFTNYEAFFRGYNNSFREFNALCRIGEKAYGHGEASIDSLLEEMDAVALEVYYLKGADLYTYFSGNLIGGWLCNVNTMRKVELDGQVYSYGDLLDKGAIIYENNLRT